MKIALIGASGFIGSALLKESLERGHKVTALVTRPEKIDAADNLTVVKSDVQEVAQLTEMLSGHEVVITAFSGHARADTQAYYEKGIRSIIDATKQAGVRRILVVGGAGSLEVAPGIQVLDTPDFPDEFKPTAEGARTALKLLKEEDDLDWTMLSPSAEIFPGEKTRNFRLGTDQLIIDDERNSRISTGDYAVAMLDELEKPIHVQKRFTVGY